MVMKQLYYLARLEPGVYTAHRYPSYRQECKMQSETRAHERAADFPLYYVTEDEEFWIAMCYTEPIPAAFRAVYERRQYAASVPVRVEVGPGQ